MTHYFWVVSLTHLRFWTGSYRTVIMKFVAQKITYNDITWLDLSLIQRPRTLDNHLQRTRRDTMLVMTLRILHFSLRILVLYRVIIYFKICSQRVLERIFRNILECPRHKKCDFKVMGAITGEMIKCQQRITDVKIRIATD